MKYIFHLLAVAGIAKQGIAAPTLSASVGERGSFDTLAKRSFSVAAQPNPNFNKSGTNALLKAYSKYNIKLPKDNTIAGLTHVDADDGSVTATPTTYDSEYVCPVDIDGQTLNLDFDSGSSDL
jgi:hypothetical protein